MFKFAAVAILVVFVPTTVLCISDEMKELAAQLRATCVAETGVEVSILDSVNADKKWSDDEKFKCYLKCLMAQMSCISDDGVVDVEATVAMMPEEIKAHAEPVIRSCGSKVGANACESAWLTHKCYFDSNDKYMVV